MVSGDLVCEKTDAILNPADVNLSLGGRVSKKILIEGGFSIQVECDALKGVQLARNFQHCSDTFWLLYNVYVVSYVYAHF